MTSHPAGIEDRSLNYIEEIAVRIWADVGYPSFDRCKELFLLYAVLAISKGSDVTMEDVHDAWSAWQTVTEPNHRSLVPFGELKPEIQELDRPYMEAIHYAASKIAT